MRRLGFAEIEPGQRFASTGRTLTEADHGLFMMLVGDWHPIHTDVEYAAADERFGDRIAHGALVLLALWPLGLLFPPPVAYGMGQVYERVEEGLARLLQDTPFLDWLPLREIEFEPLLPAAEIACVALGALVPCLLGYTVIEPRRRRLLFAALALAAGVAVAALSTALTYGPAHAWAWVTPPVRLGLPLAALAALVLAPLPFCAAGCRGRRWRQGGAGAEREQQHNEPDAHQGVRRSSVSRSTA